MILHLRKRQEPKDSHPAFFPWESGHAAPEDQALGLELELIELVRRLSDITDPTDPEVRRLEIEIDVVRDQLDKVAASMPQAV